MFTIGLCKGWVITAKAELSFDAAKVLLTSEWPKIDKIILCK